MGDAQTFTDPWAKAYWPMMREKLRGAGATGAEIEAFGQQWLHDPTWELADKQRVRSLGDGRLREEVLAAREDALRDTTTEAEAEVLDLATARAASDNRLRFEAEEMSAWEPPEIMRWVGGDPQRARASLSVEEAHPMPRASLLSALLGVIQETQAAAR